MNWVIAVVASILLHGSVANFPDLVTDVINSTQTFGPGLQTVTHVQNRRLINATIIYHSVVFDLLSYGVVLDSSGSPNNIRDSTIVFDSCTFLQSASAVSLSRVNITGLTVSLQHCTMNAEHYGLSSVLEVDGSPFPGNVVNVTGLVITMNNVSIVKGNAGIVLASGSTEGLHDVSVDLSNSFLQLWFYLVSYQVSVIRVTMTNVTLESAILIKDTNACQSIEFTATNCNITEVWLYPVLVRSCPVQSYTFRNTNLSLSAEREINDPLWGPSPPEEVAAQQQNTFVYMEDVADSGCLARKHNGILCAWNQNTNNCTYDWDFGYPCRGYSAAVCDPTSDCAASTSFNTTLRTTLQYSLSRVVETISAESWAADKCHFKRLYVSADIPLRVIVFPCNASACDHGLVFAGGGYCNCTPLAIFNFSGPTVLGLSRGTGQWVALPKAPVRNTSVSVFAYNARDGSEPRSAVVMLEVQCYGACLAPCAERNVTLRFEGNTNFAHAGGTDQFGALALVKHVNQLNVHFAQSSPLVPAIYSDVPPLYVSEPVWGSITVACEGSIPNGVLLVMKGTAWINVTAQTTSTRMKASMTYCQQVNQVTADSVIGALLWTVDAPRSALELTVTNSNIYSPLRRARDLLLDPPNNTASTYAFLTNDRSITRARPYGQVVTVTVTNSVFELVGMEVTVKTFCPLSALIDLITDVTALSEDSSGALSPGLQDASIGTQLVVSVVSCDVTVGSHLIGVQAASEPFRLSTLGSRLIVENSTLQFYRVPVSPVRIVTLSQVVVVAEVPRTQCCAVDMFLSRLRLIPRQKGSLGFDVAVPSMVSISDSQLYFSHVEVQHLVLEVPFERAVLASPTFVGIRLNATTVYQFSWEFTNFLSMPNFSALVTKSAASSETVWEAVCVATSSNTWLIAGSLHFQQSRQWRLPGGTALFGFVQNALLVSLDNSTQNCTDVNISASCVFHPVVNVWNLVNSSVHFTNVIGTDRARLVTAKYSSGVSVVSVSLSRFPETTSSLSLFGTGVFAREGSCNSPATAIPDTGRCPGVVSNDTCALSLFPTETSSESMSNSGSRGSLTAAHPSHSSSLTESFASPTGSRSVGITLSRTATGTVTNRTTDSRSGLLISNTVTRTSPSQTKSLTTTHSRAPRTPSMIYVEDVASLVDHFDLVPDTAVEHVAVSADASLVTMSFSDVRLAPVTIHLTFHSFVVDRLFFADGSSTQIPVTVDGNSLAGVALDLHNKTVMIRVGPMPSSLTPYAEHTYRIVFGPDTEHRLIHPRVQTLAILVRVAPMPLPISPAVTSGLSTTGTVLSIITANPIAAGTQSRVSILLSLSVCELATSDPSQSFFGAGIDDGNGSDDVGYYYRGACVFNILFVLGMVVFVALLCVVTSLLVHRARNHALQSDNKVPLSGLVRSMQGVFHFPGIALVPLNLMLQPTLSASVALLSVGRGPLDHVIGAFTLVTCLASVGAICYVVHCRFPATLQVLPRDRRRRAAARWKSLVEPAFHWRDASVANDVGSGADGCVGQPQLLELSSAMLWKHQHLQLFADTSERWYSTYSLVTDTVVGILNGVSALGIPALCALQLTFMTAVYAVHVAVLLKMSLVLSPVAHVAAVTVNGMSVSIALLTFVAIMTHNASVQTGTLNAANTLSSLMSIVTSFQSLFACLDGLVAAHRIHRSISLLATLRVVTPLQLPVTALAGLATPPLADEAPAFYVNEKDSRATANSIVHFGEHIGKESDTVSNAVVHLCREPALPVSVTPPQSPTELVQEESAPAAHPPPDVEKPVDYYYTTQAREPVRDSLRQTETTSDSLLFGDGADHRDALEYWRIAESARNERKTGNLAVEL